MLSIRTFLFALVLPLAACAHPNPTMPVATTSFDNEEHQATVSVVCTKGTLNTHTVSVGNGAVVVTARCED